LFFCLKIIILNKVLEKYRRREVLMYWEDIDEEQVFKVFRKDNPNARKGHECCECREIIPAGAKYFYIVGKWHYSSQPEGFFETYKMCLSCDRDWKTVIAAFQENGEKDACIAFGKLREAIEDAFKCGFLRVDDPPVRRWLPDVIEALTREEIDANIWGVINAVAVRKKLQPALPGL
jgi:hypothetical protein